MAKYSEAIDWLAYEDDTDFVNDEEPSLSVTASMVADLWGKTHQQVLIDLRKALAKREKEINPYKHNSVN